MSGGCSHYLPHYAIKAFGGLDLDRRLSPLGGIGPERPGVDPIAGAEARGHRDAMEAARIALEQQRAEDQADFERRLVDQQKGWAREIADVLAERMTTAFAAIETSVAGNVASILARFLDGAVARRALAELSQTLAALVVAGGGARIKVSGPEPLIARLRDRLAATVTSADYVVGDEVDVTVTIDDTIIATRLAAWAERIEAAVAGEEHGGSR